MARWLDWAIRLVAAVILLQTLYFKFTGAPESVFIFSSLGVEPWGRYASGSMEFLAAMFLLVPRTAWLGAGIGLGVMVGAIASHLLVLGVEIQGDGGLLFGLALTVFVCCLVTLVNHRRDLPLVGRRLGA